MAMFFWLMFLMVMTMGFIAIITNVLTLMIGFLSVVGPPLIFLAVVIYLLYLYVLKTDK